MCTHCSVLMCVVFLCYASYCFLDLYVAHKLVFRMDDSRIPKAVFYSQLSSGKRSLGRPRLRYKDTLKQNLKACSIDLNSWEVTAKERAKWRHTCHEGVKLFETNRTRQIIEKRMRRKASTGTCPGPVYTCGTCSRVCGSRIGLLSHERTHHWLWLPRKSLDTHASTSTCDSIHHTEKLNKSLLII